MATVEQTRLEALLAKQERTVRSAFRLFVREVKSDTVLREVRLLLRSGQVERALLVANSYIVSFGSIVPQVFQEVGINEADDLWRRFNRQIPGGLAISFDPTHPKAAALMRSTQLDLIREMSQQQLALTRRVLADAFRVGDSVIVAARQFRDSIGLTQHQWDQVGRYRRALEEGSRSALDRALRDRRFDSSVRTAIESGRPLSRTQINQMVERYRDRAVALRSETIARTESLRIIGEARQSSLEQVLEQADLPRESVTRTWRATQDERTRDTHASMSGQRRGLDEPFMSPSGARLLYPGDRSAPAAETINCRCTVLVQIKST